MAIETGKNSAMANKLIIAVGFVIAGILALPKKTDSFISKLSEIFKDDIFEVIKKYIPSFVLFQIAFYFIIRYIHK